MLRRIALYVILIAAAIAPVRGQEPNPAPPPADAQGTISFDELIKHLKDIYPAAADKQGIKAMYRIATCAREAKTMREQIAHYPYDDDGRKEMEKRIDDFSKSGDCGSDLDVVLQSEAALPKLCPAIGAYTQYYNQTAQPDFSALSIQVNEKTDKILESLSATGEEIEGPKRIVLRYINRLRYSFGSSVDVTIVQNPSLPQAFIVADLVKAAPSVGLPDRDVMPGTKPATAQLTGFNRYFQEMEKCNKIYENQLTMIRNEASEVMNAITTARADYQNTLYNAPAVLSRSQAEDLRYEADRLSKSGSSMATAIKNLYPSDHARVALISLNLYLQALTSLEATDEFKQWSAAGGNAQRYIAEKQRPQGVKELLAKYAPGSDEDKTARSDQEKIAYWKSRFEAFSKYKIHEQAKKNNAPVPDVFNEDLALVVSTDCNAIFGKGKESKITYIITDLYGASSQTVSKAITAVCAPLLTVSAGVGFTTLGTQTPGFVSSASPATSNGVPTVSVAPKIGFSEKSQIKPLYVVQMNALLKSMGASWNAHGTLGAAAVSRTDTTNLEWLFGVSLAYKRAFYMTAALHLGKQSSIAGGFTEGQDKPATGLDTVPTRTDWNPGFAFTITYPLHK